MKTYISKKEQDRRFQNLNIFLKLYMNLQINKKLSIYRTSSKCIWPK